MSTAVASQSRAVAPRCRLRLTGLLILTTQISGGCVTRSIGPGTERGRASAPLSTEQAPPRLLWTASQFVGLEGASVSRDARYLLYTDWAAGDLGVRDLRMGASRRITTKAATEYKEFPEFFMQASADGTRIVYIWDRQPHGYELRAANRDGSSPRLVYKPPHGVLSAYDLSLDGTQVVAVIARRDTTQARLQTFEIVLVRVADGFARSIKQLGGDRPQRMIFSPSGRWLACELQRIDGVSQRDVVVLDTRNGTETAALSGPTDDRLLGWSPDGTQLAFSSSRDGALAAWAVPVIEGQLAGTATLLRPNWPEHVAPLGMAASGAFYYTTPTRERTVYVATVDLQRRRAERAPESLQSRTTGAQEGADWSPDGNSIAWVRDARAVVVRRLDPASERVVATFPAIFSVGFGDRYVRWSPDATRLLVPQGGALVVVNATTGEAVRLGLGLRARYGRWSSDGRALFYARLSSDTTTTQIVRRDLTTQQERVIYRSPATLARAHDDFHSLELSPDDRWLAFAGSTSTSSADTRLAVVRAEGGDATVLLEVPDSEFLTVVGWTPDAREILFTRDLKFGTARSRILWGISATGGPPRSIELGTNVLNSIRFHPDGRRVVFDSGTRGADVWVLDRLFGTDGR